jgi:pre-mRNA-processing factor SLU7
MVNNHTDVWGSWYDPSSGTWGYACCHSIIHVSYCSGQAGIEAAQASSAQNLLASTSKLSVPAQSELSTPLANGRDQTSERAEQNYSKKRIGEGEVRLDEDRLSRALNEEKKRKARGEEDDDRSGKKRKNAGGSHDVTEEELGMLPVSYGVHCIEHF